jgi:hypothetical protein
MVAKAFLLLMDKNRIQPVPAAVKTGSAQDKQRAGH